MRASKNEGSTPKRNRVSERYRAPEQQAKGAGLAVGMGSGLAVGVAFGFALDNIGLGIALGVAIGAGMGTATEAAFKKKHDEGRGED